MLRVTRHLGHALLVGLCLLPASATAQARGTATGSERVAIWKSDREVSEGLALLRARANPRVIAPRIQCIVPRGTAIAVTDAGFSIHRVVVLEGQEAGCSGSIPVEAFAPTR